MTTENPKKIVRLGEIAESIFPGIALHGYTQLGRGEYKMRLIGTKALQNNFINLDDTQEVQVENPAAVSEYQVRQNDILMVIRGTIFKAAVCNPEIGGCLASSNLTIIRLRNHLHIGPYLLQTYLNSPGGQKALQSLSQGSATLAIRPKALAGLSINLPSEKEIDILEKTCKKHYELQKLTYNWLGIQEGIMHGMLKKFMSQGENK